MNSDTMTTWRDLTAELTAEDLSTADVLAMLDLVQAALAAREGRR